MPVFMGGLTLQVIVDPVVDVLTGVVAALYSELRMAKEGAGVEDMASAFD